MKNIIEEYDDDRDNLVKKSRLRGPAQPQDVDVLTQKCPSEGRRVASESRQM